MLVHCVTPANRDRYTPYLEAMFRQRAKVFAFKLQWKALRVNDGMERDEVDDAEGVCYLLTIDDMGDVVGSVRVAPTTGPHLLAGPLKQFAEREYDKSFRTWEITRFMPIGVEEAPNKLLLRGLLSAGLQEFGVRHGITRLVAVTDEDRLAGSSRNGWRTEMLSGLVETDEGIRAAGVIYHVSREIWLNSINSYSLSGPVTIELPPCISNTPLEKEEAGFWSALAEIPPEMRTPVTVARMLHGDNPDVEFVAA